MVEFYLRKDDPLSPVYEVDAAANTWRLVASRIGVAPEFSGTMKDGAERFRSDAFVRVWPKGEADGVVTYTTDAPAAGNETILPVLADPPDDWVERTIDGWRGVDR